MKVVSVVGARPQFIKASAVSRKIREDYSDRLNEVLVHTGQHYDDNMSGVFFSELEIPAPLYNLNIVGATHGESTGRMLAALEGVLMQEKPDFVLVYGDTNSTLAAALAAAKLLLPIAHVEAGLRSFNMRMPEEVNRIVTDRLSTLLFCPTQVAVEHLAAEGLTKNVHNVGDVMYDLALRLTGDGASWTGIDALRELRPQQYVLATCHRAENTDDPARLSQILKALSVVSEELAVVLPLHPRTRKCVQSHGLSELLRSLIVIDPLPFRQTMALERSAKVIVTDSGGMQKEAFFYRVPCVTIRDETEWTETVELGWNTVVGAELERIVDAVRNLRSPSTTSVAPYGSGNASRDIIEIMLGHG